MVKIANMGIDQVIKIERFSELGRLLRVTFYDLLMLHERRSYVRKRGCIAPNVEKINQGEALWIKNSQNKMNVREGKMYQQLQNSLRLAEDEDGSTASWKDR